ncbi:DNA internalization-related competence protein ComEC/Rec2 [Methylobacter sp. S3L5C]|uniref:DNA internalization-related competence protein ComEC/Rec2 n=1 Tax=Methylobacter sp. S3L5C TaxID=2839024 RepID=UPI001FAB3B48|nr:DNA internalization-related competence protein ComEC/Rec2 [Methylobacter sp. S3L5C]UOA08963.1 DNA internalization-related competence protein ComEC/Rec2 [Methylobacter sp. S3L5C]
MIVSALSFLAGLLVVQQFSALPGIQWLIVVAASAGIMAWLRYWRWLFFVIGLLWAIVFAMSRLADRLPESLEGIDIPVNGFIVDLPEQDERSTRFDFVVTHSAQKLPSKIRLSWYFPDQTIKAGEHWSFTVKLKQPHGSLNPGGFDYERWLFTQGVSAVGYVRPTSQIPVLLGRKSAWSSIAVWRQSIIDRLSLTLPDSPSLALIKALTIGDGSSITQNQWDVFRKTGTTHLVVISGSHVGLIAGLVYFLVLNLWARTGLLGWSPQRVATVAAMVMAVFYAGLAGFSVPTQRSVIMLAIVMLAIFLQRNTRPFNTLAVALFAVLIFDPLAVLSVGFWLSFLAVSLIVYTVAGRLGNPGYLLEMIKINWATSVGLSPLLLFFFQQVSLCSPLANFIAVPVISLLVVPLSLLGVIIMFASQLLAGKLFMVVDIILQGLWWLLVHLAELPLAIINHAQPPLWALVLAIPGVLLLLAPRGIPARWLSLVMFLPLVFTASKKPESGAINMTLLDVGQALSIVVQTTNHWLVYDAGSKFSEESDIGKNTLLPFLRQQGVSKINKLIISHGDNDHIGGAVSLLAGMPTEQVLTSAPEQLSDYSPVVCATGQSWEWDSVRFTLLSPQHPFVSENDNSCVLKIQSKQGAVLLTSDIEAAAESWLVETYGNKLKADILIAPHHGSKTSSTLSFLQAVQPDYVLISSGYRNQFGHPHQDVLAHYQRIKAKWFNSADSGALTISVAEGFWLVQSQRDTDSKYWNFK